MSIVGTKAARHSNLGCVPLVAIQKENRSGRPAYAAGQGTSNSEAVIVAQDVPAFRRARGWQQCVVFAWGALAFLPVTFLAPQVITGAFADLNGDVADVLGTGAILVFFQMLAITPLITIGGPRWFVPLRWWFGEMFFFTAITDLIIAAITTGATFHGGFLARTTGHTFLLLGTSAALLSVPLALTSSHHAQRALGRNWKPFHRVMTYLIWALILLHLLLLFGYNGQRFLQAVAGSIPLAFLRLPVVRRWWVDQRKRHGWQAWWLWLAGIALAALFCAGMAGLVREEVFKGVNAFMMHPVSD